MKQVMKSPVKRVSIGMPLETRSPSARSETRQLSFKPEGAGFSLLRTLLGPDWLNKVRLDESLDESRLKVEVLVSYTRTTSDAGRPSSTG